LGTRLRRCISCGTSWCLHSFVANFQVIRRQTSYLGQPLAVGLLLSPLPGPPERKRDGHLIAHLLWDVHVFCSPITHGQLAGLVTESNISLDYVPCHDARRPHPWTRSVSWPAIPPATLWASAPMRFPCPVLAFPTRLCPAYKRGAYQIL
jgi:hypothetical protein